MLYIAITAVLVCIPNITLSVAQNNISTIEPIKTYNEKSRISVISCFGIFVNFGCRLSCFAQ